MIFNQPTKTHVTGKTTNLVYYFGKIPGASHPNFNTIWARHPGQVIPTSSAFGQDTLPHFSFSSSVGANTIWARHPGQVIQTEQDTQKNGQSTLRLNTIWAKHPGQVIPLFGQNTLISYAIWARHPGQVIPLHKRTRTSQCYSHSRVGRKLLYHCHGRATGIWQRNDGYLWLPGFYDSRMYL